MRNLVLAVLLGAALLTGAQARPRKFNATFYTGSRQPLADGTKYSDRRDFCAAPASVPLGTEVRIHCPLTGRTRTFTVRDRGRFGPRTVDICRGGFVRLAGRAALTLGRIPITYRILTTPAGRRRTAGSRRHRACHRKHSR